MSRRQLKAIVLHIADVRGILVDVGVGQNGERVARMVRTYLLRYLYSSRGLAHQEFSAMKNRNEKRDLLCSGSA